MFLPDRLSEEEKVEQVGLAIAQLADIRPEGAIECMLAVQMLATHDAAIDCLRRAAEAEHSPAVRDMNYRHAAKMLAIYERQVAALDRRRDKAQPGVVVKYVHVADGGQAIVGNVSHGGRPGIEAAAPPAPDLPGARPTEPAGTERAPVSDAPTPRRRKTGDPDRRPAPRRR